MMKHKFGAKKTSTIANENFPEKWTSDEKWKMQGYNLEKMTGLAKRRKNVKFIFKFQFLILFCEKMLCKFSNIYCFKRD